MPAMRPWTTRSTLAARPISAPPASAGSGVKSCTLPFYPTRSRIGELAGEVPDDRILVRLALESLHRRVDVEDHEERDGEPARRDAHERAEARPEQRLQRLMRRPRRTAALDEPHGERREEPGDARPGMRDGGRDA